MNQHRILLLLLFCGLGMFCQAEVDFNRDVRPILSDKCFACHGFDEHDRKADLRLDTPDGAVRDLGGYAAIVPGDLKASEAWHRIISDDPDEVMPPPKFHKELTQEEKKILKTWIESGAEYKEHWSYAALISDPKVEELDVPGLIDHHITRDLKKAGLELSSEADRVTLARRLHFDLLGLPPSPERVATFVADKRPDAFERLVDELLASDAFGERMAVYWLDLVRYADTIGYHSDNFMEVSSYRDYVIDAFNQNMPYDQFTIEQLAGDLLDKPTQAQRVASGYNRLLQSTEEGGAQAKEYMAIHAADRVRNASTVWLGSTIGCAQCHDHKYDPFTAKDFYAFAAFFADVKEKAIGKRSPNLRLPTAEQEARKAELQKAIAAAKIDAYLATRPELVKEVDVAFSKWLTEIETLVSKEADSIWKAASVGKIKLAEGGKLEKLDDGSLLNTGKKFPKADYVIDLDVGDQTLSAIRLEVMTHPKLNKFSRGNGNFVLTSISLEHEGKPVAFGEATASFSQGGWPVANALDNKSNTGWAIDGHTTKATSQEAMFKLAKPLDVKAGQRIRLTMRHQSAYSYHNIGRFRITTTDSAVPVLEGEGAPVPSNLLAIVKKPASERSEGEVNQLRQHFMKDAPVLADQRQALAAAEKDLKAVDASVRTMLVSESLPKPRMTRLLNRGDWMDETGEVVEPALPAFLPRDEDLPSDRRGNRLDLAQWIVGDSNPLTSRTFVNRVWMLLFGEGISRDVQDLGGQGKPPSHPELLDEMSIRFREGGWNIKNLVRDIVHSKTYRQSSIPSETNLAADPGNELLSRQGRWRVDAEFVRDTALQLSDLLVSEHGGASVKPYQPAGYWQHLNFPRRTWQQGAEDELYRRGLYTFWCRTFLHPALIAFDAPSREECTAQRARSNIPQQALTLLNAPSFIEASRHFAVRMHAGAKADDARLTHGWKMATSRDPEAWELKVLQDILAEARKEYTADAEAAAALLKHGASEQPDTLEPAEAAAWTQVARTILNAYETTSRH